MDNTGSEIGNTTKSVVLGHPDLLIGQGISAILAKANYEVVGTANTEATLKDLAWKHKPDIILFEPAISDSYVGVISEFRKKIPKSVVSLITKKGTFNGIPQAIKAGASGCISVDTSSERFTRLLQSLLPAFDSCGVHAG